MSKVYLLLADGFEEIEAITPVDILRRAGINIETVSIKETKKVTGNFKIDVMADKLLSEVDLNSADMLVLPGGLNGMKNLSLCDALKESLINFDKANKWIAAICASPKILGDIGILNGRNAICYPGFESSLTGAKIQNERVVVDDHIITANGPGSSFEFSYKLVEILNNLDHVEELKNKMVFA